MFAVGHSVTLLAGVLANVSVSSYLVDAIIGLSVVYKALDNMGAYQRWFGFQPDTRGATLVFGLFHGLGLATKLQDFEMSADGLVVNLIAFWKHAYLANVVLMALGFTLTGYQLVGYFVA
jgi:hypothetical protein